MNYQKHWTSFTHKSLRMMTMCSGTRIGKYISHITVEPVLFLYMLSTFSQYALFQDLVYSKVCWTKFSKDSGICQHLHNEEYKKQLEVVQTTSSLWILMSTISLVIPSLLIAMYLGSWSDKFGRKWPVVFPPLGGVCACLVYIVISVVEDAPVGWICLASLLSGLTGGFVTCISSCMTYIASVSTPENRTVRISRLEAMTFFGGTVGPFISGTMLEVTGHAYAFFYMMLCYAFAFLYALLFVKDINKDGVVIDHDARSRETRSSSEDPQDVVKVGRSRNKSSDTIPSSVVATTLSSSSGGLDLEQKEALLSTSNLHVAIVGSSDDVTDNVMTTPSSTVAGFIKIAADQHPHPELESYNHEHLQIQAKDEEMKPTGSGGISRISHLVQVQSDNDDQMIIIPARPLSHHINDTNNRSSMGRSSGRNSSLHGHDDGSSAASDDDQRNMIRRSRHSSTMMDDEIGESAPSSCCIKYFGTTHVSSAVFTVLKHREHGRRTLLVLSLIAGFMFMVITAGEMDVAYLYARAEPLKWSYQTYSYYFGFKYGFGAFILLAAMPCVQKLGIQDSTIAIVGMISRMAALVLYGLSVNSYMAFSVPAVAVFSVFTIPATRSLLSKLVSPDEQGKIHVWRCGDALSVGNLMLAQNDLGFPRKMFAFVAMMEDICTLAASLVFNSIYPLTRPILQGLIFLLAASTLVVPITIMCFVRWKMAKIRERENAARVSKGRLLSVDGTDPAALLCIPKDYEVGK